MRTLLALTALMLLLATAVWWKTRPADSAILPPTSAEDPLRGVITMGVQGDEGLAEASFPTAEPVLPSDAAGDHEDITPAGALGEDPNPLPPLEPSPDPAIETPAPIRYTVQAGDSLYRILMGAYGSAAEELLQAVAAANALDDPSALAIGQILALPRVSGFRAPRLP